MSDRAPSAQEAVREVRPDDAAFRRRLEELGPRALASKNAPWVARLWGFARERGSSPAADARFHRLVAVGEPIREAAACYLGGQPLASLCMAAAAIERALDFELREANATVDEQATLSALTAAAVKAQFTAPGAPLHEELEELSKLRADALRGRGLKAPAGRPEEWVQGELFDGGRGQKGDAQEANPLEGEALRAHRLMEGILEGLWQEWTMKYPEAIGRGSTPFFPPPRRGP